MSTLTGDTGFNVLHNNCNKKPENTPDYNRRLSTFFTTVARHFLSCGPENRRLDFLAYAGTCHTQGQQRLPDLLSWVPDWSGENPSSLPLIGHDGTLKLLQHPRLKEILEDVADLQRYDEISFTGRPKQQEALQKLNTMANQLTDKTIYRATQDTLPNFTLHEESNILELKGLFIDRAHSVGDEFPRSGIDSSSASEKEHIMSVTRTPMSWHQLATASLSLSNTVDIDTTRIAHHIIFERTLLADLSHPTFDFTLPSAPVHPAPADNLGCAGLLLGMESGLVPMDDIPGGKEVGRVCEAC